MKGKIVFVNTLTRLAAAEVGGQSYIVFEYPESASFEVGGVVEGLQEGFGHTMALSLPANTEVVINVLSSAMSYAKAKLVVAPWQEDANVGEVTMA